MKYGVFIGRFQPFHNGHLSVVLDALSKVDKLIIAIGSCNAARNIKNPWTAEEREAIIRRALPEDQQSRLEFVCLNDYTYNDNAWTSQVQNKIDEVTEGSDEVTLFGPDKDRTTYYLSLFPQWNFSPCLVVPSMDATRIREMYFHCDLTGLQNYVPDGVYQLMRHHMMASSVTPTNTFMQLKDEFEQVSAYKSAWKGAPYPPTFVTTDAVVIKSGHVLVVRRGFNPGKGLIALPGGFLNQGETIQNGCLRELKEETQIAVAKEILEKAIVGQRVFDHPDRSLRGRTITHAFCIDLGSGSLPKVKLYKPINQVPRDPEDDAEKAFWMPIGDVPARSNEFFEDHAHIITHFLNRF